jgi:UDP-GlcNAc3NAcA epimerase
VNPVGYLEMVWLISNSNMIITDSGGLQKEAYFFNKICITLRNETEWVELIDSGNNILVGTKKEKILDVFYSQPVFKNQSNLMYGDGSCSKKIIDHMINYKT